MKLRTALLAYAVIALLAGFTLDGVWRAGVWAFLGILAFKSWLVVVRERRQ
jgi:hypothetical protein